MGVRGLTTYINYNQNAVLEQYFLHDTNLVVDGHSLCAQLYGSINCFSAFGGEYDKFASCTRNFFKSLRKCNVQPYVLFDGSLETRKLKTAYNRLRSKIHGASKLDPVTQSSLQIFPLLLRDVFKEVLNDMNVPYTICEFEADDEIAAMARHLDCPVLSYDSDFFIYNVLYIPFKTLETKPIQVLEDGNKVHALECMIYKVENLVSHFGGLNIEMLPLLATLLGNDYVEKRVFNKFFSQLKLPKGKTKRNEQQRCIHALFNWLRNETLDSAVSKIIGRLKKNQKDRVFAIIKKSIAGYSNKNCRSLKYFNINTEHTDIEIDLQMPDTDDVSDDEETVDSSSEDSDSSGEESSEKGPPINDKNVIQDPISTIPEWFAEGIRNKTIPQSYINLYTHHLHFCIPQAEDYTDNDSFLCTLPILRYSFDILTDFSQEDCVYVSRENDNNYKRVSVDPELSLSRLIDLQFYELSDSQLKSYFYHFLKEKLPDFSEELLQSLPDNCKLFMISMLWWIANCSVPLNHVHALLVCYTMLEVIDEKTGTFRGHHFFNNKFSKKIQEFKKRENVCNDGENEAELCLNKNKVQYEDCLIAASVLLKYFEIDDSIRKKPKSYDVRKIHSFAQFQCCLHQFNCLNTLCREPFEPTKFSKSYNGTFIYNVALKLENQENSISFVEQQLKGACTLLMFYKSLCIVFENCLKTMKLETVKWSNRKQRRRRKKNVVDDEINFIVQGFESEVVI